MTQFEVVVRVRSSPETTFWFVAEPANGPRFDPTIVEISTEPYPMRLGSRNTVRARMLGLTFRATTRVVEFEPGVRMTIESERPSWPAHVRAVHRLEPDGDGTRYTYRIEISAARGTGWLVRLLAASWERNTLRAAQRLEEILGPLD